MTKRILLAGLLGGLAMFVWESVAHLATPLAEAGIRALDNEPAMMAAVRQNIKDPGFYFFPAPEFRPGMTFAERNQAMRVSADKMKAGPNGIMVVVPGGLDSITGSQLAAQFGCDVLAMLLAAFLLARAVRPLSFGRRVLFVAALGVFPSLAVEVPNWNWYHFPALYMGAQCLVHLGGFLIGGLAVAWIIKRASSEPIHATANVA